jgi:hypothetical protein
MKLKGIKFEEVELVVPSNNYEEAVLAFKKTFGYTTSKITMVNDKPLIIGTCEVCGDNIFSYKEFEIEKIGGSKIIWHTKCNKKEE